MATAVFPRNRARNCSTSSMGVLRSASLNTRCSPVARSMPRRTAAPLPVLRSSASTCSCGQPSAMVRDIARVLSLLPSSTTSTSYGSPRPSRYARILTRVAGRRCSSLYAGTMMLSICASASGAQCGGFAPLEPPVDREHQLPAHPPWLDRKPPGPFEADPADRSRRAPHPAGEEVEGAADADARCRADRPEIAVQEVFLTAGAEGSEDHLGMRLLDLERRRHIRRTIADGHHL